MEWDVTYLGFVVFSLYVFIYRNSFKNWNEIESSEKVFPALAIIFFMLFSILSLLTFFG